MVRAPVCLVLLSLATPAFAAQLGRGAFGASEAKSLLQTYDNQLSGSSGKGATPVTRVVNLLKEMQKTLNKDCG